MKSQTQFFIAVGLILLIFGIVWFNFSTGNQEPEQLFTAIINRDCAPWDGSAFRVAIPMNDAAIVDISIWRLPDIRVPVRFSFPDESMKVGNALLLLPVGLPEQLSGKVSFQRVEQGIPVEGEFDLLTETGQHFKGKFIAEWEKLTVYCG
jgi:hypothetical protein